MTDRVFISYRRDDTTWFARALFGQLERSFPPGEVFMDVKGIGAGQDFARVIEKQVKACDAMLVLIGPNWLRVADSAARRRLDGPEDFVRIEVELALRFGKRIVPVLEARTEMPRAEALPDSLKGLSRRNAVGLTHERFEAEVQALVKALEEALVEAERARQRAEAEVAEPPRAEGLHSQKWWRTGLERASSVCSVRERFGQRMGTGFLAKAGDLGLEPSDELVVLTNFHVVNQEGALGALTPETTEIVFESIDPNQA
jgi:hypothetical protein